MNLGHMCQLIVATGVGALLISGVSLLATTQQIPSATDNQGLDRIDQRDLPLDGKFYYAGDGNGVKVFIIDIGFYKEHNEFSGRITVVGNFAEHPTNPSASDDVRDCSLQNAWEGHGTHNASYAAGTKYGVAKKARIYVLGTVIVSGYYPGPCPEPPLATAAAVKAAIDFIVAHKDWKVTHPQDPEHEYSLPGVINISTGDAFDPGVQTSILVAINAGFTVTLSAGNHANVAAVYGTVQDASGAKVPDKAIIAAVTDLGDNAQRTDYGSGLTLYAPGVGTRSAAAPNLTIGGNPNGSHIPTTSGVQTPECAGLNAACDSYAAPVAAGVAAAYLSRHPNATPQQVRNYLIGRAVPTVLGLPSGSPTPNRLLQTAGQTSVDFDGDRSADIAVFRPRLASGGCTTAAPRPCGATGTTSQCRGTTTAMARRTTPCSALRTRRRSGM